MSDITAVIPPSFFRNVGKMNFIKRLLGDADGVGDMIYAYKRGLSLMRTEMAMRQNREDIGRYVRLPDNGGKPSWGAWLTLSVTTYITNIPPGAVARLYNAWGELRGTSSAERTSYLIEVGGLGYFGALRSDTAAARVVVEVEHEEDGESISLNSTIPLVTPYVIAVNESDYRGAGSAIGPADPRDLSGREYFALLNTLVAANPTRDARLKRGLVYSDSAPSAVLERVRALALQ